MVTLYNEMYEILQHSDKEWHLKLNPDHYIYRAHFPGHPVTPGICITQIIGELMGMMSGEKLDLYRVTNIKFVGVIEPDNTPLIKVVISDLQNVDDKIKVKGMMCSDDTANSVLTKYSLEFIRLNKN